MGPTASGGRGLLATADLAPGEVALEVPLACCIVEREVSADGSHYSSRLASRLAALPASHPHVASLPRDAPRGAATWDAFARAALGNETLEGEADAIYFWRDAQWHAHVDRVAEAGDRDAYLRFLDLVCSRTLRCGDRLCAVPLLDMANHKARDEGGGTFRCRGEGIVLEAGDRGAAAGDELFLDYGARPNEDWLLHYGFLPAFNRDDAVSVPGGGSFSWRDLPLARDDARVAGAAAALAAGFPGGRPADVDDGEADADLALAAAYRLARYELLMAASAAAPWSPPP